MRPLVLAILAVLLGAGVFAAEVDDGPRSTVIYPEQQLPLVFDHARHLQMGVQCQLCHGPVMRSGSALDRNLPGHATCGICHAMTAPNAAELFPKAGCETCHVGFTAGRPEHLAPDKSPIPGSPTPAPVVVPAARLTFSHQRHLDTGATCADCHVGVERAAMATRDHLPSMVRCLQCHDGRKAPNACTTCHLPGEGGLVRTAMEGERLRPAGRFRPDDHGRPDWIRQHESAARDDETTCLSCHKQSDCLDCHDGVQKPVVHPGNWILTHGLEAQRRTLSCEGCHEPERFCKGCHEGASLQPGLFPSPTGDPPGSSRFHPAGWAGALGELPTTEHHSHVARRSLETCRACHDSTECVACHQFVSPHPAQWGEEPPGAGRGDGTVCLTCHEPNDAVLDGTRHGFPGHPSTAD